MNNENKKLNKKEIDSLINAAYISILIKSDSRFSDYEKDALKSLLLDYLKLYKKVYL